MILVPLCRQSSPRPGLTIRSGPRSGQDRDGRPCGSPCGAACTRASTPGHYLTADAGSRTTRWRPSRCLFLFSNMSRYIFKNMAFGNKLWCDSICLHIHPFPPFPPILHASCIDLLTRQDSFAHRPLLNASLVDSMQAAATSGTAPAPADNRPDAVFSYPDWRGKDDSEPVVGGPHRVCIGLIPLDRACLYRIPTRGITWLGCGCGGLVWCIHGR